LKVRQRSQCFRWRRPGALDLVAGQQARLGRLGQRYTRAHEQRLHAGHRGVHGLGDLVVGKGVDLAQQQCGALGLRQLLDVGDDVAELLALMHRVGRGRAAVALEHVHRVLPGRLWAAQVVQAAVTCDPVEPGARVDRPVVGADRAEGRGEDLLQHVLGVLLRAEHVAAEGEQPRLVALDERLEGAVVPATNKRHEPLVALEPKQGRAAGKSRQPCGLLKC
jgi:hypothetical protein